MTISAKVGAATFTASGTLEFSSHALERMRQRNVSEASVLEVLREKPVRTGGRHIRNIYGCSSLGDTLRITVAYEETIVVVTVVNLTSVTVADQIRFKKSRGNEILPHGKMKL